MSTDSVVIGNLAEIFTVTGLLLEGITTAGKSAIASAIQEHPAWRRRESKLVLSSHFTERANEHLRTRTADSYRSLMQQNLRILQAARQIESASPIFQADDQYGLCYVIERFHITNALRYAEGNADAYIDVELELERLGCRLALISVNDMMISGRLSEARRLKDERWRETYTHIERRHGDVGDYYVGIQEEYRKLVEASKLEHIVIDATDGDWPRCVRQILEFWHI
jgi:thymidylate kinase